MASKWRGLGSGFRCRDSGRRREKEGSEGAELTASSYHFLFLFVLRRDAHTKSRDRISGTVRSPLASKRDREHGFHRSSQGNTGALRPSNRGPWGRLACGPGPSKQARGVALLHRGRGAWIPNPHRLASNQQARETEREFRFFPYVL